MVISMERTQEYIVKRRAKVRKYLKNLEELVRKMKEELATLDKCFDEIKGNNETMEKIEDFIKKK